MDKKFQVFVSSTYLDLIEERNEVMKALLELDCIPSGMELFPSGDDSQWTYIQKVIDNCDYFIIISAGKYGSIGKEGKSYTQLEYEYALTKNIPTIAFLHQDLDKLSLEKSEKSKAGKTKLLNFKSLLQNKLCRYWNNKNELSALVSRSLVKLIKDKPREGWIKASIVHLTNNDEQFFLILKEIKHLQESLNSKTVSISKDNLPKVRISDRLPDKEKIELGILGVTVSDIQRGAYSVVLDNTRNNKKIHIIIGPYEAQALAIELEGLKPPRPLTHDLIKNIIDIIGFQLIEVLIDHFSEGVFYSILIFSDGINTFELDSRTSDALSIAIRCKIPIYTFNPIINKVGKAQEPTQNIKRKKSPYDIKNEIETISEKTISIPNNLFTFFNDPKFFWPTEIKGKDESQDSNQQ